MNKTIAQLDLDYIIQHTSSLWEEFRGQSIFITGGTGFFGRWILSSIKYVNEKRQLDIRATILTRDHARFKADMPELASDAAFTFIEGDVRDFAFPDGAFPFIIHAATDASAILNAEQPLLMFETIVLGTRHTLEFAKKAKTRKFLFVSSGAIYGVQSPDLLYLTENYLGAPDTMTALASYAHGKRFAEHWVIQYAEKYQFAAKIARCFAFVGPFMPLSQHFAMGNFIRDAIKGGPIQIMGDGTPLRSYLYAADLIIWLWTILCLGAHARPYNVGSYHAVSILELARTIAGFFSPAITIQLGKSADATRMPARYVPAVDRAMEELSLPQPMSLDQSILRTIAFYT